MAVAYDLFAAAFLSKVTEYDFLTLPETERLTLVDGFMKRAIAAFQKTCLYDLSSTADDRLREFQVEIAEEDLDEILDIVSEGMVVQWLKPYVYKKENLENVITTRDFSTYSPANLLSKLCEAHEQARRQFTRQIREYSYDHGDLTTLHL